MSEEPQLRDVHYDSGDLADYFAGETPDEEAAELERHLANCDECRTDAGVIGVRSQAWIAWTSDAPQVAEPKTPWNPISTPALPPAAAAAMQVQPLARKAAVILPFEATKERTVWRYAWAAAIPAAAAIVLFFLNQNLQGLQQKSALQIKELTKASADANLSRQRVRDLERQIAQIRDQLATARNSGSGPASGPDTRPPITIPVVGTFVVPLTIESRALGPAEISSPRELSLSAQVPPVRLEISLPDIRPVALIDATLTGGDLKIEHRSVPIDRSKHPALATLVLNQAEVKKLLNREIEIKLTDRGFASVGAVMVNLRLK